MADEQKYNNAPLFLTFGNMDIPRFLEVKGKKWISYGDKNDYPYFLIDLYTQSSYHSAIIDGKVSYICGNGWGIDLYGMTVAQKAQAMQMLNQAGEEMDLDNSTTRWTTDLEVFNGFCIVVAWSKNKKTAKLRYIDMANIRTNADESEFYYTKKWFTIDSRGVKKENKKAEQEPDFKTYKRYDPKDRTGEQIYYYKSPHPDQYVYPLPVYRGAIMAISNNIELEKYFYHTVKNQFVPTHLINFYNGEPSQEKADEVEARIKAKWTSPEGSRIIVNFAANKDTAADVETLSMTDADKQFEYIGKSVEQSIFTAHGVTSGMLFGVFREGTLGGRSELIFAEEHFQNRYISSRQRIMENAINEIANDIGIEGRFYLNKVRRVGYMFDDATIKEHLKPEEIRSVIIDQLGIKPMEIQRQRFSAETASDSDVLEMFKLKAHTAKYEVIFEREVNAFDKESIQASENEFRSMHFASEIKASALERIIIDLLQKDGTMQPDAIAKVAKSDIDAVNEALVRLAKRGIIEANTVDANGESMTGYNVTEKGIQALDEKPAKTASVKVVYRYGLAPRFKDQEEILPNGRTREFCAGMIRLSKAGERWTSEDIFSLDPGDGINAWTQRGGWYTRKDGVHVPQCRHAWIQQLVKEIE